MYEMYYTSRQGWYNRLIPGEDTLLMIEASIIVEQASLRLSGFTKHQSEIIIPPSSRKVHQVTLVVFF